MALFTGRPFLRPLEKCAIKAKFIVMLANNYKMNKHNTLNKSDMKQSARWRSD